MTIICLLNNYLSIVFHVTWRRTKVLQCSTKNPRIWPIHTSLSLSSDALSFSYSTSASLVLLLFLEHTFITIYKTCSFSFCKSLFRNYLLRQVFSHYTNITPSLSFSHPSIPSLLYFFSWFLSPSKIL